MKNEYILKKLTRHDSPMNKVKPMVNTGDHCVGRAYVIGEENDPKNTEVQEVAKPKIGKAFMVHGNGLFNFLRTSMVIGIYNHSEEEINETGVDKLVLPSGFPASAGDKVSGSWDNLKLEEGDILLSTLNSIYLVRKYK